MKYTKVTYPDLNNGVGCRASIWLSGCSIRCKECFNSELWNPEIGTEFTESSKELLIDLISDNHCAGLSVLGGEPTDHDDELSKVLKDIKKAFPDKTIWMWSGHTMEDLINLGKTKSLEYVDFLIDGPFIKEESDLSLKFRGSKNQTIWERVGNNWRVSLLNG